MLIQQDYTFRGDFSKVDGFEAALLTLLEYVPSRLVPKFRTGQLGRSKSRAIIAGWNLYTIMV